MYGREEPESGFESDSAFEDLSNLKAVPQSPWHLFDSLESCEEKENQFTHHLTSSIRENSLAEQSYSHILSALGSVGGSATNSPEKKVEVKSLCEPTEEEEEGGNTLQDSLLAAQLSGDVFPASPEKPLPPSNRLSLNARTTDQSDHIEIDLYDSNPSDSEELSFPSLGSTPTKAFCPSCQRQVLTVVAFIQPKMPLWDMMCELLQCCNKTDKGHDVMHECRRCGRLLARVSTY